MKFNKKGLSEVVTTVIIILLVLVAIGIVWAVVNPTLKSGAQQVSADCLSLSLEPVTCDVTLTGAAFTSAAVQVKRNAGSGTLTGLKILLMNGATPVQTATITPVSVGNLASELGSGSFTIVPTDLPSGYTVSPLETDYKIKVAAVTTSRTCDPNPTEITCT